VAGLLETIQKEWPVIRGAPWSFAAAVIAIGIVIAGFSELIHHAEIAGKDATIETQKKTEIDAYKDKLNGATPDEAKKQIDDSKARIADLETRVAKVEPRGLKDNERIAIKASLESIGVSASNIVLSHELSCTDCAQFATDFGDVLKSAHWGFVPSGVMGAIWPRQKVWL
jgi:hypothetical protein